MNEKKINKEINNNLKLICELTKKMLQNTSIIHETQLPQVNHLTAALVIYIPMVILIQGTLTNLMTAVVFLNLSRFNLTNCLKRAHTAKTTTFRQNRKRLASPIYFYLFLLSIFDLGVLLFGLFNDCLYHLTLYDLKHHSSVICKLFTFLAYFFSHCSSSVTVTIVMLRFLFIHWANAACLFKINCFKNIIFGILGTLIIINLHLFWSIRLENALVYSNNNTNLTNEIIVKSNENFECQINETLFNRIVWPIVDKLIYCILPFILITFFNIYILRDLKKKTHRAKFLLKTLKKQPRWHSKSDSAIIVYRKNLNKVKLTVSQTNSSKDNATKFIIKQKVLNDLNGRYKDALKIRQNQIIEKRFTFMLICISFVFLILTFPIVLIHAIIVPFRKIFLYSTFFSLETFMYAQRVSTLMMYVNHSAKFFVYFLISSKFRKVLKSFF